MTEHNTIKIGYDLDVYEKYNLKLPISIPLQKCPHWLICGNSGSGKSYLTLMLLRNVLKEFQEDVRLWIMDFKSSEDFSFLKGYSRYYCGADCENGLEDFYSEYQKVKNQEPKDNVLRLIIFDEWAGFQIWETQRNKKQAEKYKGYLLEILLMGRSMMCGAWVIMQRNDAKYIDGREQFFVTVALGKMSREFKQMIMQGEDLEQRAAYSCGEGIIRADSIGTKFLKVPKLRSMERVRQEISERLTSAGDAGGVEGARQGGTPTPSITGGCSKC